MTVSNIIQITNAMYIVSQNRTCYFYFQSNFQQNIYLILYRFVQKNGIIHIYVLDFCN